MIAMKFGGSSVESGAALERVIERIRQHVARRPVVIISAMGRTTRKLLAAGEAAAAGRSEQAREIARELRMFHEAEARPLTPPGSLDATFELLFGELEAARDVNAIELALLGGQPHDARSGATGACPAPAWPQR